jgi:hypothetical protein
LGRMAYVYFSRSRRSVQWGLLAIWTALQCKAREAAQQRRLPKLACWPSVRRCSEMEPDIALCLPWATMGGQANKGASKPNRDRRETKGITPVPAAA